MSVFELKCGGKTDFKLVFDYADGLIRDGTLKRLGDLMYFTDGHVTYPFRRPAYNVAFVFVDDMYREHMVPS